MRRLVALTVAMLVSGSLFWGLARLVAPSDAYFAGCVLREEVRPTGFSQLSPSVDVAVVSPRLRHQLPERPDLMVVPMVRFPIWEMFDPTIPFDSLFSPLDLEDPQLRVQEEPDGPKLPVLSPARPSPAV